SPLPEGRDRSITSLPDSGKLWPMKLSRLLLPALLTGLFAIPPATAPARGADTALFRVEAIVFTPVNGESDDWPVSELTDFGQAVDPKRRALALENPGDRRMADGEDAELEATLKLVETMSRLEDSGQAESTTRLLPLPTPWLALDALDQPMQQALSRLQRSGAYRVHATLAWHQPIDRATRQAVHVHDDRVLGAAWANLSPVGRLLRAGRDVKPAADLHGRLRYRLDGSSRLRKRQSMHADIHLARRADDTPGASFQAPAGAHGSYRVHRLEQS